MKCNCGASRLISRFLLFCSSLNAKSIMVKCNCGAVGIIRTSGTKRNPGRPYYACPLQVLSYQFLWEIFYFNLVCCNRWYWKLQGPRSGFISWVDEENHKNLDENKNRELEILIEELQMENRELEIQNEEVEIRNRNLKMLLIVSWVLFFGIIVYKL